MIDSVINNLSISTWNVQGLGDKCNDDNFNIKYDINILLETWKGIEPNINIPDYNFFQKCRKKKKRSKRFSGCIIVAYKSVLHKGITEIKDITASENRLWLKLDKHFFSFNQALYICACYIPPVNSLYYNDNFSELETDISKIMTNQTCHILIMGDLNARILNCLDHRVNENISHESLENLLPDNYNLDINIQRYSVDQIFNSQGQQLIDLASQFRILNGRFVGDSVGNFTCYKDNGASTVDYALADMDLLKNIDFFQVTDTSYYLSDHVQIATHLQCSISLTKIYDNDIHSNLLKYSYNWGKSQKLNF